MKTGRRLAAAAVLVGIAGAAAFWLVTAPTRLDPATVAALGDGDAVRGERIFWAGGCTSCHSRPKAEGEARLELAGGMELATPFGTFVPPNISPDPKTGIGEWTVEDFANSMMRGVSPEGENLYPAFPYTSYARMSPNDLSDLYAFMMTLPPVSGSAPDHDLSFPYNIRRGIGLWKRIYLSDEPVIELPDDASEQLVLGRYLAEGPGHCGECHSARDLLGGTKKDMWLAGATAAEGPGIVPNITPQGSIADWSAGDIVSYLETGFTPDFDSAGGSMVEVQKNMAKLRPEDREAIAAYLKAIPPHPNGYPPRKTTAD